MAAQVDVKESMPKDQAQGMNGNLRGGFRGRGRGGRGGRGIARGGSGGGGRFNDNRPPMQNDDKMRGPKRPMPPGGPNQHDGGQSGNRVHPAERIMNDKLNQLTGNTYELPPLSTEEKKFSGRSRLYIGNIAAETTEDEINDLFKKFGETSELFINREKCFGFIRMDFHYNAAKAKGELDGYVQHNKNLKIRFSPNGSTIKVKNLDDCVTNELLHLAFSIFGDIDRAVVIVDDRGKPTGEGIVEYARKSSAQFALRKCCEGCFFITSSLRPVLVEPYEVLDDTDGYADKLVFKRNPDYYKLRSVGPRFAGIDSFEHEYGMRWKQLFDLYAQKEDSLKKELELEKDKLVAQMELARYEHETEMLRDQLRVREMDMDRQKLEWESKRRQAEDARQRQEEDRRRQEEEMQTHMMRQEEEMRRRQEENNLFRQAHQLDSMLNQEEQGFREEHMDYPDNHSKQFNNYNSRGGGQFYDQRGGRGSRWGNDNHRGGHDDFMPKRRRY